MQSERFRRDFSLWRGLYRCCRLCEYSQVDVGYTFKHGFDPAFTLAIVFPELIRYSSLRDYVEVHSLEVLYVQYGKAYSDFSVGRFQIKPSFAEKLEADAIRLNITDGHSFLSLLVCDTSSSSVARKARVERLTDIYDQVLYIELFTLVMNTLYPDWYRMPAMEKLDFYATAYNAGYYKGEGHILAERYKKRFYTGVFPGSAYYSYTMIARRAWCLLQSLLSL